MRVIWSAPFALATASFGCGAPAAMPEPPAADPRSPVVAAPVSKSSVAEPLGPWRSPRIPDFSFAGYRMGDRPLPRVVVVQDARDHGVTGDDDTDDAKAIQTALDATHDGALELPAGRFVLGDSVRLSRSHVVLRGQGPDKTILVVPRSLEALHPPGDPIAGVAFGFIDVRGSVDGAALGNIVEVARRGDRRLRLDGSPALAKGELIRVRMGNDDALLRLLLGNLLEPGPQTPRDYQHYVDWVTPVVSTDGPILTIARPLRVDVRPEWQAQVLAFQPTLEEVGIEDLSFEFAGVPPRPHPDDEGFNAIYIRSASHAWVRNVTIIDADNGIVVEDCRFCQVENVRLAARRREAPSGHHALWAKQSQDCLFTDFEIETQFHDEVTVEAFSNGNVFQRGRALAMALDHHRNAPYDNLFTDLDVGDPTRLWKSGGDPARGPHAGVRATLWNVRHDGRPPPLPGAQHFDKPDAGWPELNVIGVAGYAPAPETASCWIDPAPGLAPNLYELQRRARRR
jgi:hypothetical protein